MFKGMMMINRFVLQNRLDEGNPKKTNEIKPVLLFKFRCRYKDDVLSLNNSTFGDYFGSIYPIQLEIMDANYNEGRLRTTKKMI